MRSLIAIAALVACSGVWAQIQLNEISNNTVADADKVMENFRALESAIDGIGGCTATQQTNSVLIECADGSSGVLAAGGTVLIFPEAILGEAPDPIDIPTGDFAVLDAEGQLLGGYQYVSYGYTVVELENIWIAMRNNEESQSIQLRKIPVTFFYSEENCQGAQFITDNGTGGTLQVSPDHSAYLQPYERLDVNFVSRSRKQTDSFDYDPEPWGPWYCVNEEQIQPGGGSLYTYIEVTLPDEILNAVYPFRVEIVP